VVDGGEPGVDSRDEGKHTGRNDLLSVHSHRASVHQAAKLAVALLRVARVTAGLAESNGSLPSGL